MGLEVHIWCSSPTRTSSSRRGRVRPEGYANRSATNREWRLGYGRLWAHRQAIFGYTDWRGCSRLALSSYPPSCPPRCTGSGGKVLLPHCVMSVTCKLDNAQRWIMPWPVTLVGYQCRLPLSCILRPYRVSCGVPTEKPFSVASDRESPARTSSSRSGAAVSRKQATAFTVLVDNTSSLQSTSRCPPLVSLPSYRGEGHRRRPRPPLRGVSRPIAQSVTPLNCRAPGYAFPELQHTLCASVTRGPWTKLPSTTWLGTLWRWIAVPAGRPRCQTHMCLRPPG